MKNYQDNIEKISFQLHKKNSILFFRHFFENNKNKKIILFTKLRKHNLICLWHQDNRKKQNNGGFDSISVN